MLWSEVDELDDGLTAAVTWLSPLGLRRYVGTIEHRADHPALLHPHPLHHPPENDDPGHAGRPVIPPPDSRVHVIGPAADLDYSADLPTVEE
jgi:hypothetical protein